MEMDNEGFVEIEQEPFKQEEINATDDKVDFSQFDLGLGF